ncbi:MAG: integrase [Verrucomicrobiales bacterium]|jgi:integrase
MADLSEKSGQEVAKIQKPRSRGRDQDYWKERLFHASYSHGGQKRETKDWCIRIQHAGHREIFNLGTPNKAPAASRAKQRYDFLLAHGWEAARAEFKHEAEKERVAAKNAALTIGQYIELTEEIATGLGARTIHTYGACLRRLVADMTGRPFQPKEAEKWKAAIDRTPLDKISATAVEKWKAARLKKCDGNPKKEETAKTTMNSILRQCRALFGRKFVPKLREDGVVLPDPLPFANVDLFKEDTSAKFRHTVDPAALVRAAAEELAAPQRDDEPPEDYENRSQKFLAFLLCFAAGLRKREADTLEWSAVEFENGLIRIQKTEFFKPKTNASAKPVTLDAETVEMLRGFRARYPEDRFVLRSKLMPKPSAAYAYYRAEKTWVALADWLRDHGVDDEKPVHHLRKAITAIVAKKFGIFAAQRHARHTTPAVTARFYSDSEESVAPGIGDLFT